MSGSQTVRDGSKIACRSRRPEFAAHKTVPVHRYTVIYYLGGMTLFFFIVQVMTGIMLMLYYRPSADEAFESVEFIMTTVPFGWLIRSLHSWSANLMVFFAFRPPGDGLLHQGYRKPREITWVTGCSCSFWPWRSASRAISCPGTSSRSSPPRWAPTSPGRVPLWANGRCVSCAAATGSPAAPCRGSMAGTWPSCRRSTASCSGSIFCWFRSRE